MQEQTILIQGPAGLLELAFAPATTRPGTTVLMCHPHPLHGGSMNNKVVTTLCNGYAALGCATVRFNFRGVGQSAGEFDHGVGECQDAIAVLHWLKTSQGFDNFILAGFSFGAFIALSISQHLGTQPLLLVAPPIEYPEFNTLKAPKHWSLIVAGSDEVVSTPAILAWTEKQTAPQHLLNIEDASHFFHGKLALLKSFIQSHGID